MKTKASSSNRHGLGPRNALALLVTLAATGCDQGTAERSASSVGSATSPAVTTAPETARPDDTGTTAAATQGGLRAAAPKEYDAPEQAKIGTLPPDVGLAVGSTAPDFELPDSQGRPVKLSQLATDHNVLLVFYRGGW
jgi:hypothetical protein